MTLQLNTYRIIGEIAIIYTAKKEPIITDLKDFELLSRYQWRLHNGYAYAYDPERKKQITMHRLLMESEDIKELVIDHLNHQPWDNRRSNLKVCTTAQNLYNAKLRKDNTSGYPNISYISTRGYWAVYIRSNGKRYYIGSYKNIEEAIQAQRRAKTKYHGYDTVQQTLPLQSPQLTPPEGDQKPNESNPL